MGRIDTFRIGIAPLKQSPRKVFVSLPDDYDVIVLNGVEYYKVDQTVYRTTLMDGNPYLEVLGQQYR